MINFELYLKSSYSFNGSLIEIESTVEKAVSLGYKTLALVDNSYMYGIIKFYKKCLSVGIKPIIGLEVKVKGLNFNEQSVLLYAKNNLGYQNLILLSSYLGAKNKEISIEYLKEKKDGLIGVLVSDRDDLSKALYSDDKNHVKMIVEEFSDSLDSLYLGLDLRDFGTELKIAPNLSDYGKTVITHNVIYLNQEEKTASKILKQILDKEPSESGFFDNEEEELHLRNLDELDILYENYPLAIQNSYELIEECEVIIDFSQKHLPEYPLEEKSAAEKLKELAIKGLKRRLKQGKISEEFIEGYQKRLDFELAMINKMGFNDYFLIVWDFVLYAKKQGIIVGPGRGSAAGSLVAYALGIVDVDPLEFDLFFERFLNPERITMPDIDMDFPDDKRDEVIRYVVDKYGENRVVSIVTFGTFQGKSAIRDVGRVLNVSSVILDELTSKISETSNSIHEFKKAYPKEYNYYMNNSVINELLTISEKLNGLCRHTSTHAAGIIITKDNINKYAPTQHGLMDILQSQYEASDLEELGLLKIDFLGIRNLSIVANTVELIKKHENIDINVYRLSLDDQATYKLLQEVNTLGIFQLESDGMMNLLRQLKVEKFIDIANCISLHRPGPMENIPSFIRRKHNTEKVDYLDSDLIPILDSTYGIIVYQEQIMQIANKFAGYSLGEADVLRRAVSKKNMATLIKERTKFVQGVIDQGYNEDLGNQIYDYIVKFANYGFNKSHAVAYSYVAYWMAYLKANYPNYFLAVLLNAQIGSVSGTRKYIKECQRMGLKVLPPKINKSGDYYRFENKNLRYPYKGIKGIGEVMAKNITSIQEDYEITSFVDFMKHSQDIGVNVIEALILANVFSDFGINKKTMINNISNIQSYFSFNNPGDFKYIEYEEYDYLYMQSKEKEMLGINFEYHIIHHYQELIKQRNYQVLSSFLRNDKHIDEFIALISKVKKIKTKRNEEMAFITLEDEFEEIDGVVFPKVFSKVNLSENKVYLFKGKLDYNKQKQQIIIESVKELGE